MHLFISCIDRQGRVKSESFLQILPTERSDDLVLHYCSSQMKVVNDMSEHAVNLIQKYNKTLTKYEE